MEIHISQIHTTNYQIIFDNDTINCLNKEWKEMEPDETFEEFLIDFFTDLYDQPDEYDGIYGIKIIWDTDWENTEDITVINLVKNLLANEE